MKGNKVYIYDLKAMIKAEMISEQKGFDDISEENKNGALRAYKRIYHYLEDLDILIDKLKERNMF